MTERNDSFNSDKLIDFEQEYADAMEEEGELYNQRMEIMGGKSRKQKHSRKCKKSRRKSLFTRFF